MDLDLDADTLEFQSEVRSWLSAHVRPLSSMDTADGFAEHRAWEQELAEARLSVVSWPSEFGGRDASLLQWLIFEEEYYAAGAPPRVSQNGIFLLAPTLFAHGTDEQRKRLLPAMACADEVWAQAWSEPEAGSDLASLRSTAVRCDGGWLLRGQKTWSSRATFADKAFGLFRTDPAAERHRGLTYLVFDLRSPGVTVRPIAQLDGEPGFAEIFLDDVFVPDCDVLGAVGEGWRVAMSTASNERGLSLRSPGRFLASASRLVSLWKSSPDAALRDRVVDAWIGAQAHRLHTFGTVTRLAEGGSLGAEASVTKVFWSELDVALHETALDLLGPHGEVSHDWLDGWLFSLAGPIYAGTNEIQRNVIAERLLGLPPMRFALSAEQTQFASVLHDFLSAGHRRLEDIGVTELTDPVDLVVAFEELGHHAVPGPLVESIAVVPALVACEGTASVAFPPHVPYAPEADVYFLVEGNTVREARPGAEMRSVDPTRRLFELVGGAVIATHVDTDRAFDLGALTCAAQLVGLGRAMLEMATAHARLRTQFGKPIGGFQAVKHLLADVLIGLELARPLVHGAAITLSTRDVSAAKVAAGDAAHRAARTALQVHGAIGYTAEHDLSRFLTMTRALVGAWGTASMHRSRVLAALVAAR